MSLLAEEAVNSGDISDFLLVMTYVNATGRDLAVLSKVEIGSLSQPLAGSGNYALQVKIEDSEILPRSAVQVTTQPYITVQSRHLSLQIGQTMTVYVKGLPADTAVDVETVLLDVTPVLVSDLSGTGTVPVDHNYGGTDALRVVDPDGAGIQDAAITAYLAADYNAGRRTVNYVRGRTTTSVSGRWRSPLSLDASSYVLVIARPADFQTVAHALVVSS